MKYLSTILVILFLIQSGYVLLARDYDNYVKSSACIKSYTDIGVARENIGTSYGACYLLNK